MTTTTKRSSGKPDDLCRYYEAQFAEAKKHMDPPPVMVSPEEALLWLKKTKLEVEKTKDPYVHAIARDILNKEWRPNGQTVSFDRAEQVSNGKTRFAAIAMAGVPVPMSLVKGIDHGALLTIDAGRARTGATVLHELGISRANFIKKAIGWLALVRAAYPAEHLEEDFGDALPEWLKPNLHLSNSEIVKAFDKNRGLAESAAAAAKEDNLNHNRPVAVLACAHYLCTRRYPRLGAFLERGFSGTACDPGSDEERLKKFMRNPHIPSPRTDKERVSMIAKIVISARMHIGLQERTQQINWTQDGAYARPFPRIPVG